MSDEHDSWFKDVFGVDLGGAAKKIEADARAAAAQAVSTVTQVVQTVQTTVGGVIDDAVNTAAGAIKQVANSGGLGGGGLKAGGPAAPRAAPAGGGTGKFPLSGSVGRGGQNAPNDVKAVQRALGLSDDGQCGTGTITAIENFQRSIGQAKADGRVDAGGGTERALAGGGKPAPKPADVGASASILGSLGDAASTALDWANTAGKAVMDGQSAAWDATKGAYTTVTNAYDSVAPNFTQSNRDLGGLVDKAEAAAKKGNNAAAAEYGDIPVLGAVVKASTAVNNAMIDATGGVVKGVGDLAAMAGNAVFHPIDATVALAEGALGIAEHVPIGPPGFNTTVKGIHGLVDLARGKEDGEYGSTLEELAENLLRDTKKDPKNPNKRTNADLDFLAGLGGGKEAWTEKPVEAAVRTLVNLAPMILGDEGAGGGGGKPPPEGGPPIPEGGPPKRGPAKTVDLGKTQAEAKTLADAEKPVSEPEPAPANESVATRQARQNLADAEAVHDAAHQADLKATQDFVRYREKLQRGDPSWDPNVDKALEAEADRAGQESIDALNNVRAARAALTKAIDAASLAKKNRGGGGFQ